MLLFHGSPGIGKTYFCAGLIEYAVRKFPHEFRYFSERELFTRLRTCISEGHGDYLWELGRLTDSYFLILDDVGSNINPQHVSYKDHEWKREIFFSFLDIRYNLQMPTVITSNFTKEDFKEIYSERICSRLFAKENTIISLFGSEHDKRTQGL